MLPLCHDGPTSNTIQKQPKFPDIHTRKLFFITLVTPIDQAIHWRGCYDHFGKYRRQAISNSLEFTERRMGKCGHLIHKAESSFGTLGQAAKPSGTCVVH